MPNERPDIEVAVLSETGLREENQDWMSWRKNSWGECCIVADGMGGYKGGATASRMTVEGLERYLGEAPADWPFATALQQAIQKANEEVYRGAHSGDPDTENMGSTVVVALLANGQLHVAHVGDSRAYLFRNGGLTLLTKDHTSVQRMLDAGLVTPQQAREHPDAHILSRAVGTQPDVDVEIQEPMPLQPGDGVLLCSDGLSGYATDSQIEQAVRAEPDVQNLPKALVDLALRCGSDDNITVQFIRYGTVSAARQWVGQLTSKPALSGLALAAVTVLFAFTPLRSVLTLISTRVPDPPGPRYPTAAPPLAGFPPVVVPAPGTPGTPAAGLKKNKAPSPGTAGAAGATHAAGSAPQPAIAERKPAPPAQGALRIEVDPQGAQMDPVDIWVDDVFFFALDSGKVATIKDLQFGPHNIELKRDGYKTYAFKINIGKQLATRRIRMQKN